MKSRELGVQILFKCIVGILSSLKGLFKCEDVATFVNAALSGVQERRHVYQDGAPMCGFPEPPTQLLAPRIPVIADQASWPASTRLHGA